MASITSSRSSASSVGSGSHDGAGSLSQGSTVTFSAEEGDSGASRASSASGGSHGHGHGHGSGGAGLAAMAAASAAAAAAAASAPSVGGSSDGGAGGSSSAASVFGGGRGWEGWDREEGHRALGQSYQRHAMVLRDADAGSDVGDSATDHDASASYEQDASASYDVDEFGSISVGDSGRSSASASSDASMTGSGTRSGSDMDPLGRHASSSGRGSSGSASSAGGQRRGRRSSSSGANNSTGNSSDPSRIFGRIIRPSREGLAAQSIMAKRRSIRSMGMESFLSSMEQGDHLEQRRMTKHASSVSLSGKASKQGDSGKEERAGGGFFRTSKFRLICAAMAVATAVIGGVVVVLYLKDSEAGRGKSNSVKERFMAAVSYGNEETGGELDGGSPVDILIPKSTSENYADLWETFAPTDFPFFWLNPISSEPYIKQIYGNCYSMILSGQITEGQPNQTVSASTIRFFYLPSSPLAATFHVPISL